MIRLKSILFENQFNRDNAHSWQTPVGTYYRVRDTHDMDARQRITGHNVEDAVLDSWRKGFNRIHYYGDTLYVHNEVHYPSDRQIASLIQLALHNDFNKIVFDKGDNEKVLWTRDDMI